jgi:hypothetical protein
MQHGILVRGGTKTEESDSNQNFSEKSSGDKMPETPSNATSAAKIGGTQDIQDVGADEKLDQKDRPKSQPEQQQQQERRPGFVIRHTSDMLHNLVERSAVVVPESVTLRQLIMQRSQDYAQDLMSKSDAINDNGKVKLPKPQKVLHYLAPKIPAIKHSPDVNLRIQTARSDIDPGVAACLIGAVAHVCEVYDKEVLKKNRQLEEESQQDNSLEPSCTDIVKDRRFEQLVECLVCGINVQKRKREYMTQHLDSKKSKQDENGGGGSSSNDIEEILEGEQVEVAEGLNIRDMCRAAWGLAVLGAHHHGTLGNTKVMDLLIALSLRIRELLLSRMQLLRQGDLMEDLLGPEDGSLRQTPEQRLDELAEELAEDAASAMWTFACVRACTGMRSAPLFETCCSILCQDPVDLRRRAQEAEIGTEQSTVGINDVVDRLARSEAEIVEEETSESENVTLAAQDDAVLQKDFPSTITKKTTLAQNKEAMIDWLSPNELTDVLWALAVHGHSDSNVREEIVLSETAAVLKEIAFDRLMELLKENCSLLEANSENDNIDDDDGGENQTSPEPSTEEYISNEGEAMTVEVVDAAALLASENAANEAVVTSVENLTSISPSGCLASGVRQVEVVDAAAILRSTTEQLESEFVTTAQRAIGPEEKEERGEIEEIYVDEEDTTAAEVLGSQLVSDGSSGGANDSTPSTLPAVDEEVTNSSEQLYFSPHDLCALAWAVTELRDSLRFQIVDLVIDIFARLGEDSLETLAGADLANLAWAIARHSNDARPWSSESQNADTLPLTIWIVRRALIVSGGDPSEPEFSQHVHVLDPFQPPELSRLMWAVASTVSAKTDKEIDRYSEVDELAINALVAASAKISELSPEDLVCAAAPFDPV